MADDYNWAGDGAGGGGWGYDGNVDPVNYGYNELGGGVNIDLPDPNATNPDVSTVDPNALNVDPGATEIPNYASEGTAKYGWKYYSDGTQISPDGKYYKDGNLIYDPASNTGILSNLGSGALGLLKKAFTTKDANGNEVIDWRSVIGTGAGLLSLTGIGKQTPPTPRGYQGKIPTYSAVRAPVAGAFAPTKAGEPNRRYFSDTIYATPDKLAEAQTAVQNQATGIAALQDADIAKRAAAAAQASTPDKQAAAAANPDWNKQLQDAVTAAQASNIYTKKAATGGLMALNTGHYLRGGTDGMADKLRTTIDNNQPAALSHGEFVIPADVVSHLGNGNSEAGAQRLYAMMDKVRQARTGTKQQGKKINPDKYMPA